MKKELKKDIIDILDNVKYWETCPEDYKLRINEIIKQLRIGGVRSSSWIKFEETKFVEDGMYSVKTNEGRIILAERFKGSWMEYDTPIKENESVLSYYA